MYKDIESEDNRLLFILVCETSIIQTSCYSNRIHSFLPVFPIIIKWNASGTQICNILPVISYLFYYCNKKLYVLITRV